MHRAGGELLPGWPLHPPRGSAVCWDLCPVRVWYRAEDASPVLSIKTHERLSPLLPTRVLHFSSAGRH